MGVSRQVPLGMWKADIDSAYRRMPLKPGHRNLAAIVFIKGTSTLHHAVLAHGCGLLCTDGTVYIAVHWALPFGSIASVHGWDRMGSLLRALARKLLKLPVSRYCDDFFAGDRSECAEHGMVVFARFRH